MRESRPRGPLVQSLILQMRKPSAQGEVNWLAQNVIGSSGSEIGCPDSESSGLS